VTAPAPIARRQVVAPPAHRAARELAALAGSGPTVRRPKVTRSGDLIRVGDQLLDQAEAVRLWSDLGAALGLAERERRPQAWGWLTEWLEDAFNSAIVVDLREGRTRHQARLVKIGADRAMAQIAPFEVAHLRRRRAGSTTWIGTVGIYTPGPLAVSRFSPDASLAFTRRTVRVGAREIDAAPEVRP
jgi:hypothetical protein